MITNARGIILHTIKYAESSIICKIFTKEYGLLSFIVNGVRSSKSKAKAGIFQPLNVLDIVFILHENKHLLYLKEYRLAINYQSLPFEFHRSSLALFVLELLNKTIKNEREPNSEKYEFIEESLLFLDEVKKISANFHLAFMVKYITYIGFEVEVAEKMPYFDLQSGQSISEMPAHKNFIHGIEKEILGMMKNKMYDNLEDIKLNKEARLQIFKHLEYYYGYHIENFSGMKSPEIISAIYD